MAEIEFANAVDRALEQFREHGVIAEVGLTDTEVAAVEARFEFRFPPDLRALLQSALPVGIENQRGREDRFPNWRSGSEVDLRDRLGWPMEGIEFDIENNDFWHAEWGARPPDVPTAIGVARQFVANAPKLIPVCGHRYLPSDPCLPGNPVFSVYQTDIIVYGDNVWDYIDHEFGDGGYYDQRAGWSEQQMSAMIRPIPLWSSLAG